MCAVGGEGYHPEDLGSSQYTVHPSSKDHPVESEECGVVVCGWRVCMDVWVSVRCVVVRMEAVAIECEVFGSEVGDMADCM